MLFLTSLSSPIPLDPFAHLSTTGKVLLFSTKSEAPAIYKALAMQFAGKSRLLFAWSQASSEGPSHMLMQRMNVSEEEGQWEWEGLGGGRGVLGVSQKGLSRLWLTQVNVSNCSIPEFSVSSSCVCCSES